jgi:hypothetical protein
MKRLGDLVHDIVLPIASAIRVECIDPKTGELFPDSNCAKRQAVLNEFSDKVYDMFWNKQRKEK